MPDVFVYSCTNLTNIWAGIGSRTWAVAASGGSFRKARETKSRKMRIGSLGLIYCVSLKALTTPFIVASAPDYTTKISHIWPEVWEMPFRINPLGTPEKMLPNDTAMVDITALRESGKSNIANILPLQGVRTFEPFAMSDEDWEYIMTQLAH